MGKRKFLILVMSILILALAMVGCVKRDYSPADLKTLDAKKDRGIVIEQSLGSFILMNDSGKETLYRTGELTQYIPLGYRSQKDDQVRVVYQEIWESSGRVKKAVLQLEALTVPEKNKQLSSPVQGQILGVGRGSMRFSNVLLIKTSGNEEAIPLYVSRSTTVKSSKKTDLAEKLDLRSYTEKSAEVFFRREPIFRGNAYIYVAEEIVIKD